jgi:hypothetical protein
VASTRSLREEEEEEEEEAEKEDGRLSEKNFEDHRRSKSLTPRVTYHKKASGPGLQWDSDSDCDGKL